MAPVWTAVGVCCLVIVLRAAAAQRHTVRALLTSALCGAAGLAAVSLLTPWTGVRLPVNAFTGGVAAVLGLPGVILMLLLPCFL